MMASSSRCACANIPSDSLCNIIPSAAEFTIRSLTISSSDSNLQSANSSTAKPFDQLTSRRSAQGRNPPKAHREQRCDDCAPTQQHECRTMRSEAILHCTDDCRTNQAAHVRDCHYQGDPGGCRRSSEEPRRHRPKWAVCRAVSDRNQREEQQCQCWFPQNSAAKKSG